MKQEIIDRINQLVQEGAPFLFVINYKGNEAYIRKLSQIDPKKRASLLHNGAIQEADITTHMLLQAQDIRIFNAMIDVRGIKVVMEENK